MRASGRCSGSLARRAFPTLCSNRVACRSAPEHPGFDEELHVMTDWRRPTATSSDGWVRAALGTRPWRWGEPPSLVRPSRGSARTAPTPPLGLRPRARCHRAPTRSLPLLSGPKDRQPSNNRATNCRAMPASAPPAGAGTHTMGGCTSISTPSRSRMPDSRSVPGGGRTPSKGAQRWSQ